MNVGFAVGGQWSPTLQPGPHRLRAFADNVAFTNYWFYVPYPGFPFTFRFPPTSLVDEVSNARPHRLRLFMRTLLAVGEKQGRQPEQ